MLKNSLSIVLLVSLAYGCASTYKPLEPSTFTYQRPQQLNDLLQASYLYDVQTLTGNRRYARKEKMRGMISVAVKIENLSSASAITISKDNFKVYADSQEKTFYTPIEYSKKVKQRVGAHLLHALYGPWAISWQENSKGETDVDFIYIPVGRSSELAMPFAPAMLTKQTVKQQSSSKSGINRSGRVKPSPDLF